MKRQDLDHRWQFLIFGIKMGKNLYKKPAVGRKVGTDRFRRTGRQDVLKKAQDLLFHIKRKSSTVKGKGWKPEKTSREMTCWELITPRSSCIYLRL